MRWLALTMLLAAAPAADARRIIRPRDPPVVGACRGGKDWAEVARCLGKIGKLTIERSMGTARLVHVIATSKDWVDTGPPQDLGIYLYVQAKDQSWHVGGMYQRGDNDTFLGLVPVTITKHDGWRLDVGSLSRSPLSLDGAPPVPVTIRTLSSLYCSGEDHRCVEIQTMCEVTTRGKMLLAFHGTLRLVKGDVFVDGDQSRAGSVCRATRGISIRWGDGA